MVSKALMFPALAILLLMSLSTATICYQESANVSNQSGTDNCAGLSYSGAYGLAFWSGIDNPEFAYDGSWATNASNFPNDTQKFLEINYSIPNFNQGNTIWQINYTLNDTVILKNLTLNTTFCNASATKFQLLVDVFPNETSGYFDLSCQLDGGSYANLYALGNPNNITGFSLTEEGIYWNLSDYDVPTINLPANTSYTNTTADFYVKCAGSASSYLVYTMANNGSFNTTVFNAEPAQNNTLINATVTLSAGTYNVTHRCVNGSLDNSTSVIFSLFAPAPPTPPVAGQNPLVLLILSVVGVLAIILALTIITSMNYTPEAIIGAIVAIILIIAVFLPILNRLIS